MIPSFADILNATLPHAKAASGIKPWAVPNIAQGGHTMATTGKVVGGAMGGGASAGGGAVTPVDSQNKSKASEEEQPAPPTPSNPMDASLQISGVDPAGVTQQHEMAQSEADLAKAKAEAEVQKLQQSAAPKGGGMEAMSPAIQAHQMTLDHQKQMAANMAKEFGNLSSRRMLDQRIKSTLSKVNKVVGAAGIMPHQIKLAAVLITLRTGHDFTKSAYGMGPGTFKPATPEPPKPLPTMPSNLNMLTKARAAGNTKAVQATGGTVGGALLRDQNMDMANRHVQEYGHTGPLGALHNGANAIINGVGSLFGHEESSRNFDAFLHPYQSPALNKIQEDATKPLAPGELEAYKNPDAHMIERQQAMTDTAVKDNNSNAATGVYDRIMDDPGNTPYGADGSIASRLGNGSFRMARGVYRNAANITDQAASGDIKRMAFGDAGTDPNATWKDKAWGAIGDSLPSHALQLTAGMNPAGVAKATLGSTASAGGKLALLGADAWGTHSMAKDTAPSETAQKDFVQAADQNTLDTMKQNGGHLPGERSGFSEILNWILSLVGMGQGPSQAQQRLQGFDTRQNLIAPAY